MCYDDGALMAFVDGELPEADSAEVEQHLAQCAECAARRDALAADRALAESALGRLEPAGEVVPFASAEGREPAAGATPVAASASPRRHRARWPQLASAAAAVLAIAAFALPPVRQATASFLQVFRVQQVQTIQITQADIASLRTALKTGGHVDLKSFGEAWIDGVVSKPETVTLAEARSALDFPVKLPAAQSTVPTLTLTLTPARTYRFKLHVSAINEALAQYGGGQPLPDSVDGKVFTVRVPAILIAQYPVSEAADVAGLPKRLQGVYVGQARSPELEVPDGVDAAELRTVLLNLPFISQDVRNQLAAVQNWQSTLLIPSIGGTAKQISLDGTPAVVISPKNPVRDLRKQVPGAPLADTVAVVWNDDGVVRAVGGPMSEQQATDLARSTK